MNLTWLIVTFVILLFNVFLQKILLVKKIVEKIWMVVTMGLFLNTMWMFYLSAIEVFEMGFAQASAISKCIAVFLILLLSIKSLKKSVEVVMDIS